MILRGAQIHWDGDGKCGLLPNPTFFTKYHRVAFYRCSCKHQDESLQPHCLFPQPQQGGAAPASLAGSGNHLICLEQGIAWRARLALDCPLSKGGRYVAPL